jgi:prepilin-type N-terminal cleavage/methylation domain-containing protein/prepilin-type processing-associated H-X9-DG protein
MSQSSHRRLRAFTLIELLVVIAIIAVLAAILVPVGQSMLRSGRSAEASSNLRQIGALYGSYVADTGRLPLWRLSSLRGLGAKDYPFFQNCLVMQLGLNLIGDPNKDKKWLPECFYDPAIEDSQRFPWGDFAVNYGLIARRNQNSPANPPAIGDQPSIKDWLANRAAVGQAPTRIASPSKKVLAITSRSSSTDPRPTWELAPAWITMPSSAKVPRPDARHGGRSLALFFDGHIERLDTESMTVEERRKYFAPDP